MSSIPGSRTSQTGHAWCLESPEHDQVPSNSGHHGPYSTFGLAAVNVDHLAVDITFEATAMSSRLITPSQSPPQRLGQPSASRCHSATTDSFRTLRVQRNPRDPNPCLSSVFSSDADHLHIRSRASELGGFRRRYFSGMQIGNRNSSCRTGQYGWWHPLCL